MMLPDGHEPWSQLLPLFVNGRLEGADREQLAHHLAGCSLCQKELAEWREIAQLARQPHPGERHLQSAHMSLTALHQRIAATGDAPKKEAPMQSSKPPTTPPSARAERWRNIYAVTMVALLAVFVVAGFAVFRAHGAGRASTPNAAAMRPKTPTPTNTITPASVTCATTSTTFGQGGTFQTTMGQSVTVHGITLTLDRFYADFTRTIVLVHIQTPSSQPAAYGANDMSITTAANHTLTFVTFGGGEQATSNGMRNWSDFAFFYPLPAREPGSQQTVTLTVNQMQLGGDTRHQLLSGPWQLHITFTAVQPSSTQTLRCAPQTHHGISFQLLSVLQAPAPVQFDGYPGGITLDLCITGIQEVGFGESYATKNYGGFSSGGAVPPPQTQAQLTLPNGEQVTPQYELDPRPSCSIEGKAGQSYQLTYLASPTAFTGKAVFSVPTIISYRDHTPVAVGTWSFSFDLK